MIGVIARFGWGWWPVLARSVYRWAQAFDKHGSLPLSRDGRSCRHEASVLGAATGPPATTSSIPSVHETSALPHRGVPATLVREWRIASELSAGFPR
jgi:hypothetical protein